METQYQVNIPYILRGILIHMMNQVLDSNQFLSEMVSINQMLANLLNSYKEAGTYFERYLTQISTVQFQNMVRRIQLTITDAFD